MRSYEKIFVTGAAGFIGSNLVDSLLSSGKTVVGLDNFSTGRLEFLRIALSSSRFQLIEGDNLDPPALTRAMKGCDFVFHLAANADVRFGVDHPARDFEQNIKATFHVLEAIRANGVRSIAFSSTGSVYGEAEVIPTPENAAFPIQTSLYGASKVAGESMIQAYCEGFGLTAYIFRFVSILGARYTHGHVIDFCRQLRDDPTHLKVLGDGTQRKSYLHVSDCIAAMQYIVGKEIARSTKHGVATFNLGTNEFCAVRDSISWICAKLGVSPEIEFTGGSRGWIGDNPFIYLDTDKVRSHDWIPQFRIQQSVELTVEWLCANPWVFDEIGPTKPGVGNEKAKRT